MIFIVQGKNYSSVSRKVKSYVFVCYGVMLFVHCFTALSLIEVLYGEQSVRI